MKKYNIFSLFILLIIFLLAGCGAAKDSSEAREITVTTAGNHYPWNYKKDGKLIGYDVEVTEAIADILGYNVNWVTTDFASQVVQLESGRSDALAEHTAITEERKEKFHFTTPYAYPEVQLMVKKDSNIKTLEDLKGKKVAVALGSFYENFIRANNPGNDIEVITYEDTSGVPNDVEYGRIAAYLNDKISGNEKIKQAGLPLKMAGTTILNAEFSYPFPKTDEGEKLRDEFDEALNKLRDNGTLKKLSEKYFNEDVSELKK
ncbi:putative Histidine-binding protein [Streptomyces afghaniensis 772] [Streptomyces afghaniensis]